MNFQEHYEAEMHRIRRLIAITSVCVFGGLAHDIYWKSISDPGQLQYVGRYVDGHHQKKTILYDLVGSGNKGPEVLELFDQLERTSQVVYLEEAISQTAVQRLLPGAKSYKPVGRNEFYQHALKVYSSME